MRCPPAGGKADDKPATGKVEMPLLFMDAGCESQSRDSLSAEECSSNTSGLEREGEEQPAGPKVTKRREKNRDAARKSRKKQTERADELHQELQRLEQSNSALQKEIAALKKDQQLYETALKRHKPHCLLRASASSSPSASSSAHRQAGSSPPQASNSISPSPSPSVGPQSLNCTKETDLSPSASALTIATDASSAKLSSSSNPSTFPYPGSFSSQTAPHSLFSQLPRNTSRSTNVTPACGRLVSNPAPGTAARLQPEKTPQNKTSAVSQRSYFPGNAFSPQLQASVAPLEAENTSVTEQSHHISLLQFQLSGNPNDSKPPCELLPSALPDPAPKAPSASPHVLPFSLRQSHHQQFSTNPAPLLSMLTVPSPLSVSQTTSSSMMDEFLTQPSPSLPPPAPQLDPFKDLSLSEFLERNDWILNGMSDE